ncbi:MAG: exonuclease domain-containing protein [Lachnospiraceae bacterium]|nr:exonuclease domain-containing protein [Lachnospiraceae bacterium]
MNYIILDLEWNQAGTADAANPAIPFEIIEIGAVKLNSKKVMIDEFSALIKPQVYKTMHYMTGKLVHIKMAELKHELPFEEVMERFLEWCGDDYIFGTWGPLDLTELQRNMVFFGFRPFTDGPLAFYDIQKLFALEYAEGKERRSLESAIDFLEIEKDIPFHRAFSDAYYAAKAFALIKKKETLEHISYDTFIAPADKAHEVHKRFSDYDKYISRTFATREAMLSDKEIKNANCHLCDKQSKKLTKLFAPTGRFFLCISYCEEHGYIKTKIRVRKNDMGRFFAVKTKKVVSAEDAESIISRYKKLKEDKHQEKSTKNSN